VSEGSEIGRNGKNWVMKIHLSKNNVSCFDLKEGQKYEGTKCGNNGSVYSVNNEEFKKLVKSGSKGICSKCYDSAMKEKILK